MARAEANWERQVRATLRGDQMGGVYGVPASGIAGNVPSSLGNNTHINEVLRAADEIQDEDPTIARIQVDQKFDLMSESLYLTVYIIDMYLSLRLVLRWELQLVGVSALLIACKYEEIWAPEVNDFIPISDSAYTREQILKMEKAILNRLEWNLTVPTPYVFLVRFAKAASSLDHKNDKEMENAVFFMELALLQYGLVQSRPSMIVAAAVYAARLTIKRTPLWTDTLRHHTGFTEAQLICLRSTSKNIPRNGVSSHLQQL